MAIERLFFDLDDTLYPSNNGVWDEISKRISQYMIDRIGLTKSEAEARRRRYYRQFGTSLTGLMVDHQVDPEDYLEYVHDIPLDRHLHRSEPLEQLLSSLPQPKAVFTNASRGHAQRVLAQLGIEAHFDRIIAIEDTGLINKPELRAYTRALELVGLSNGERSLFADDRPENLKPAAGLGMTTVLVSRRSYPLDHIDHQIPTILDLLKAVPELKQSVEENDASTG